MADLEMRFHRDMLVLSAPIDYVLSQQGADWGEDIEFMSMFEVESIQDAIKMESIAGAQCLVTPTEGICTARLAHQRAEDRQAELARIAIDSTRLCRPLHLICEIGSCGLPFDPTSRASVKQLGQQYSEAARALIGNGPEDSIDAFLLSGLQSQEEASTAIGAMRGVTTRPLFVSFDVNAGGNVAVGGQSLADCIAYLEQEQPADVYGFAVDAGVEDLRSLTRAAAGASQRPVLVSLAIRQPGEETRRLALLGDETPDNPYALPDTLASLAMLLRRDGAQFLRVVGEATPAYTGSFAVACIGTDCVR